MLMTLLAARAILSSLCTQTSSADLGGSIALMNRELSKVNCWLYANSLTLNVNRSQCIVFRRSQRKTPDLNFDISINTCSVKQVDPTTFLGIILDQHLTWKLQVINVSQKISKFVPIIYNIRRNMTIDTLKMLYNSILYPNLIYCKIVWGQTPLKSITNNPNKVSQSYMFQSKI
jgi:hypothetical protein